MTEQVEIPRRPTDLLNDVNQHIEEPYDNIHHLRGAVRKELNNEQWSWPEYKDLDGWQVARTAAIHYRHRAPQEAENVPDEVAAPESANGDEPQTEPVTVASGIASFSVRCYSPAGYDLIIKIEDQDTAALLRRGSSMLDYLEAHQFMPLVPRNTTSSALPTVGSAPPASGNGGNGGGTFAAEELSGETRDGNVYWKVRGGSYKKFGVTIWPEVLATAFNINELNPLKTYNLAGYTAHYEVNDKGKPGKVVKLEKAA